MPYFGIILIIVVAVSLLVYIRYPNDIRKANQRISNGSKIIDTDCGPIEFSTLGEGSPVLVLHGTSGGWDQSIAAPRGLVEHGFQLIAPSRFGYLCTPLPSDPLPPAEADAWICFLDALNI